MFFVLFYIRYTGYKYFWRWRDKRFYFFLSVVYSNREISFCYEIFSICSFMLHRIKSFLICLFMTSSLLLLADSLLSILFFSFPQPSSVVDSSKFYFNRLDVVWNTDKTFSAIYFFCIGGFHGSNQIVYFLWVFFIGTGLGNNGQRQLHLHSTETNTLKTGSHHPFK